MLQIRLLGQFDVRSSGKRIEIPSRAGQSLLAYLLLTAGTPQRRERLAGLLWPDTSDENARHNLRTELWRIRKALGSRDDADHDYLLSEDLTIAFNPEAQYWLDVNQLQRPTAPDGSLDDLLSQLTLYQGELLPGFYDDWIVLERERLQAVFERGMKRLLERLCEEQRWATVLEWSERWIALGQTPEPAYRALMAAYAALGDRAKAVATFERCRVVLDQDLGVEPSPETQSLYERLLQGETIARVDLSTTQIASARAHLIEEPPTPGDPPFKGLQYFDEADADLFFGREQLTTKLIEHLSKSNFLAVIVGASGSGKSSIVRAGLIPALKRVQPHWLMHVITPTVYPLEALATALTRDSESVTATAMLLDDLAREPRSLALYAKRLLRAHNAPHLLLVIDQFEELFTLCRDEFEREAFIDNLLATITPPSSIGEGNVTLILTLRADFYAHLAQYPELRQAVAQQQEYIGPMTTDELRRAIEEPAKRGGWEFEPGLVDLILRDVGDEPGALPLLSHALLETWQRRSGHTMTLKGYADSGGVRGAIAYTAESVYQQLSIEQRDLARHIFLELTELGEGTEDTRRRIRIDEVVAQSAQVRPLLTTLADARLITTGEKTVEVAHEALIREWPRLRDWLNEDREGLRLHRHLTEAAHDWELLERDPGALYRGARLSQANEWAANNATALSTSQRGFLAASNELEQREAAEREAQRQRELQAALTLAETQQQSATRLRRRNRVIIAAGLVALLLATLAGLFGVQANQNAAQARAEAQARATQQAVAEANFARAEAQRLAGEANNLLLSKGDVELIALLSLRSMNMEYTPSGDATLANVARLNASWAFQPRPELRLLALGRIHAIDSVSFSPNSMFFATGGVEGLHLWETSTGQLLHVITVTSRIYTVRFSPDGSYLLSSGTSGDVSLWDSKNGELVRRFVDPESILLLDVAFSPDGQLVFASNSNGVVLFNTETGEVAGRIYISSVDRLAVSPDGQYVLTITSVDSIARLWKVKTNTYIRAFIQNGLQSTFSPDGNTIAIADSDNTVRLWNVTTGQEILLLIGHAGTIKAMAFSPDGKTIVTASDDGTARLWNVQTGQELRRFVGHTAEVNGVAFSLDGRYIATVSNDGTARLWDVDYHTTMQYLCAHLKRDLTDDERKQYGITDTAPTCSIAVGSGTPVPTQPPSSITTAPTVVGLTGEISLWHSYFVGGSEEKAINDAVAQLMMDNPSLKVNVAGRSFIEIFDDWDTQVAAGGGPDMYTAPNDNLGDQVRAGSLAPIDNLMKDHLQDFSRAGIDGLTVDGKLYGVPGIIKAVALYYNQSIVPDPPKTTDELLNLVRSGKRIAIYEDSYHNFGWLVNAFGGKLMDDTGKCVADQDSGMADALQFMLDLKKAGAKLDTNGADFSQGVVGMIIDGPWSLGDYRDALGDKHGVAPMPAGPKGPATPLAGIDGWYINPNISLEQQQLAVEVGVYLFGPKGAIVWANEAGDPMVTNGITSDDTNVKTFADAAAAGFPRPQSKEFSNWWGPFDDAVTSVVEGTLAPADAVTQACAAMNKANGK